MQTNFSKKKDFNTEFISKSEDDTINFACSFAAILKNKDIVVLNGNLGSGKTKFTYGMCKYFGIESKVSSPTFTIVNEYTALNKADINKIYHFDTYRLTDENDFTDSVGLDYFANGISIIEWGSVIFNVIPKGAYIIDISNIDENENYRKISITRKDV